MGRATSLRQEVDRSECACQRMGWRMGVRGPGGPTDLVIHSSVHTSDTYLLAKIHGSPQGAHIQWENKTQSQVNATGCRWTCAR